MFASFEEAFMILPVEEVLPLEDITIAQGIEIYSRIYSLESQMRDSVYMFKMEIIE